MRAQSSEISIRTDRPTSNLLIPFEKRISKSTPERVAA